VPASLTVSTAATAPKGAAQGTFVFTGKAGPELPASVSVPAAALAARGFEGKSGQVIVIPARGGTQILVGLGSAASFSPDVLRSAVAAMTRAAFSERALAISLFDGLPSRFDRAVLAQAATEAALLASYQFVAYRSKPAPRALSEVVLVGRSGRIVAAGIARAQLFCEAVIKTRDLVNEPPAGLTPQRFAELATQWCAQEGITCTVWDEDDLVRERCGGILGVARGSSEPPRLVRMEYRPAGSRGRIPTIALVGKGITFDSGGLSLKPSDSMIAMKSDMAGAGAVLSVFSVLARLAPSVRVVGYCCLSENMPGPNAYKLGDVLTARNGKTVEIHNTDAEGRIVLMDGLSLAAEEKPDAIIDVATLTGAQIVALGNEICAFLSNNDALSEQLRAAASASGEELWELPLFARYRKHIDSSIADMKNIGLPGQAGTIIGGIFLQEFVDGRPWTHVDIAGPSFGQVDDGIITKGGTGVLVRTLLELVESFVPPR
jgi:leucyl aminopeptidase